MNVNNNFSYGYSNRIEKDEKQKPTNTLPDSIINNILSRSHSAPLLIDGLNKKSYHSFSQRDNCLKDIIQKFLKDISINKVSEVINCIKTAKIKTEIFENIVYQLDSPNEIFTIAYNLQDKCDKASIFFLMIKKLVDKGHIDQALAAINKFSLEGKNRALAYIIKMLVKKNKIDQAKDIAKEMNEQEDGQFEQFYKDKALSSIVKGLIYQNDDIEQAQLICNEIKDPYRKTRYTLEITKTLVKKDTFEQALETIDSIVQSEYKYEKIQHLVNEILAEIAKLLLEKGNAKRAEEIANRIQNRSLQNNVFLSVIQVLKEEGEIEQAAEVTSKIQDTFLQTHVLLSIIQILIKENEIDKIKEFFYREVTSSDLVLEVVKELIEHDHMDAAQEIVKRIDQDTIHKKEADYHIFKALKKISAENRFK